MNLFKRELKANRKSLIIWSIGVIFMVAAGMGKYSSLEGTGQSMNALMADMPKSLQAIMGTGSLDLSTPIGYFGVLFLIPGRDGSYPCSDARLEHHCQGRA